MTYTGAHHQGQSRDFGSSFGDLSGYLCLWYSSGIKVVFILWLMHFGLKTSDLHNEKVVGIRF